MSLLVIGVFKMTKHTPNNHTQKHKLTQQLLGCWIQKNTMTTLDIITKKELASIANWEKAMGLKRNEILAMHRTDEASTTRALFNALGHTQNNTTTDTNKLT